MIENQLGLPFDMVSPIGELDSITEFILGIVSTPEDVRAEIALQQGLSPDSIAEDDLSRKLHETFLRRANLPMVAPVAIHFLRTAWRGVPQRSALADEYSQLEPRIISMDDELNRSGSSHDPLSDDAILAYARLSPRIAAALWELSTQQRAPGFRPRAGLWSFSTGEELDAVSGGFSDRVRDQPATLTALLPQSTSQLQYR